MQNSSQDQTQTQRSPGRPDPVGLLRGSEPTQPWMGSGRPKRLWLAAETVVVTAAVVVAIRLLSTQHVMRFAWLAVPGLLVGAALIPTWLRREGFPPIGLGGTHAWLAIRTVGCVCICALPALFLGLWLMTRLHIPIPLKPIITSQREWLTWLIYQLMYVAVAEETFFRGYVQVNIMRVAQGLRCGPYQIEGVVGMLVSATCFAVAHLVVQGEITALLTFLPGLLFAWLFLRTRSLLAPILFHGLANICYGLMIQAMG